MQNTGCGSEVGPTDENILGGVMSVGCRSLRWCAGCASRFGVWGNLGVEEGHRWEDQADLLC